MKFSKDNASQAEKYFIKYKIYRIIWKIGKFTKFLKIFLEIGAKMLGFYENRRIIISNEIIWRNLVKM